MCRGDGGTRFYSAHPYSEGTLSYVGRIPHSHSQDTRVNEINQREGSEWWRDLNHMRSSPVASVKESTCNVAGALSSIPGSGRSPGEGNGNLFQCSCMENSMDREAWWATVHGITKDSVTTKWLSNNKPNCNHVKQQQKKLYLFSPKEKSPGGEVRAVSG